MNKNTFALEALGFGLRKDRTRRIREEFQSDQQLDPKAYRTAILRTLKSYFWVSNLSAPVVSSIATLGIVSSLKSHWLWATCLLFVTLFITQRESEMNLASKAFKAYKMSLGLFVLTACFYSLIFDAAGNWWMERNMDFHFGKYTYILGGAIGLVSAVTTAIELFRAQTRSIHVQRLFYVICTVLIYLSSNYRGYSLNAPYFIQLFLTVLIFATALIKRKPALA